MAQWCHRSGSTLAQVMACMTSSRCLNQCWLYHQWVSVALGWHQYHRKCSRYEFVQWVWKIHLWNYFHINDQWVKNISTVHQPWSSWECQVSGRTEDAPPSPRRHGNHRLSWERQPGRIEPTTSATWTCKRNISAMTRLEYPRRTTIKYLI